MNNAAKILNRSTLHSLKAARAYYPIEIDIVIADLADRQIRDLLINPLLAGRDVRCFHLGGVSPVAARDIALTGILHRVFRLFDLTWIEGFNADGPMVKLAPRQSRKKGFKTLLDVLAALD